MHVSSLQGSAGELLDASFEFTRRYYRTILNAALPVLLLTVLVEVLLTGLGVSSSSSIVGMLVILVPWSLSEALAIASCWRLLHGESPTFADSWRLVWPRTITVFSTYIIKWTLIIVGVALLIAPGFYFIALFFALPTVCIAENASFSSALQRSRALSRGSFKRIAATLGFLEVAGLTVAMLAPIVLPGGTWERLSTWDVLGGWVIGIGLLPLRAALMTLLYLDRRVSKEGYDLGVDLENLSRAV